MPMARPIPVLMYHKVGLPVLEARDTFLNVPAESFRRQMRLLARLGYRARPFAEIVDAVACGHTLPRRTFSITFDDGYRCIGEIAAPILAALGFPATVFVVSGWVGASNAWDRPADRPELPLLDWDGLRHLMAVGWEVVGHTRLHPHLDGLEDADASAEILGGKQEVEAQLGQTIRTFCYPFGHFNARTPALVRAAGFRGACTARSGLVRPTDNPFTLSRVKLSYHDGVFGLLYRLLVRPYLPNLRPRRRTYAASLPTPFEELPR